MLKLIAAVLELKRTDVVLELPAFLQITSVSQGDNLSYLDLTQGYARQDSPVDKYREGSRLRKQVSYV